MRLILLLLLPTATTASNASLPLFSVSGHSSGGSMASQHFMVNSASIVGLGHLQAAPCTPSVRTDALDALAALLNPEMLSRRVADGCSKQLASASDHSICTTAPAPLSVEKMITYAEKSFKEGKIECASAS